MRNLKATGFESFLSPVKAQGGRCPSKVGIIQAYHASKPARPGTVCEDEQPPKLARSGAASSRISGGPGGRPD